MNCKFTTESIKVTRTSGPEGSRVWPISATDYTVTVAYSYCIDLQMSFFSALDLPLV